MPMMSRVHEIASATARSWKSWRGDKPGAV
jgi:hypothetical protein